MRNGRNKNGTIISDYIRCILNEMRVGQVIIKLGGFVSSQYV